MWSWLTKVGSEAISKLTLRSAGMASASSTFAEPDIATEKATFGMGCFWAPEPIFGSKKGVVRTKVGYTGGKKENPTYYSMGDHTEAIQIEYDPSQTDYKTLLDIFWTTHDPTSRHKTQYKSAIWYHNDEQEKLAKETKAARQAEHRSPIVTDIEKFERFYDAEDYHQKYHLREHSRFYDSLKLTDPQLIKSHLATRIHGYMYGYGTAQEFAEESSKWGLSQEQLDYIKKNMARPRAIHCGL
ncbi:hypothetical protein RvY_07763 [Ramazzottius varieornatus]|uniref:peptide-methionine (S)-S-oxide reductase n=1 Tax=Ramazzottius varieornatus TaxID=947166 RepID=A0A1D1V3E3_RAMVA|nr:hypothetical protein RvY_07763 [Ramazzottius varieornatus]